MSRDRDERTQVLGKKLLSDVRHMAGGSRGEKNRHRVGIGDRSPTLSCSYYPGLNSGQEEMPVT